METSVSDEKISDNVDKTNGKESKTSTHSKLVNISDELLGSVTTSNVRTSARVIHKMRQPVVPVPDKKVPETVEKPALPKTPSQSKVHTKVQWINIEKNMFFDAVNEFGRDFDAIANYINHKMKRKISTEPNYKLSYHVRTLYYQMFQKCSKYLKFSDEVKKIAQELYTLINYGEMKRKVLCLNEKCFLKLHDLVYRGAVTIRFKGKNVKIKTPSCRALRKLNQVESSLEDIQLPPRVECILRPASMEAFGKVQNLAQNPRVRATLPLQRKLGSFLQIMQQKWRSNKIKMCEKYVLDPINQGRQKLIPEMIEKTEHEIEQFKMEQEKKLCFRPPKEAVISRPLIQLNELLSSYNLCLNSYEEKIGAITRGESLCEEKISHLKEMMKCHSKRIRHDSGTEKTQVSPEMKKLKQEPGETDGKAEVKTEETVENADLGTMKLENDIKEEPEIKEEQQPVKEEVKSNFPIKPKKKEPTFLINSRLTKDNSLSYKPLLTEECLKKIREGWSLKNVGDITIGDLYLMFGAEGKLTLEYHWIDDNTTKNKIEATTDEQLEVDSSKFLGNRLKQLLAISNLLDRNKPIVNCTCGHICEKKIKMTNDLQNDLGIFKQPAIPCRNIVADMNYRSNLNFPKTKPSKWLRNRNLRIRPSGCILFHDPNKPGNQNNTTNHIVRNLYQNQPSSSNGEDKEVQITTLIEDKINKLSKKNQHEEENLGRSMPKIGTSVYDFSESSRSSIRSLLDCLLDNQNGTDGLESTSSVSPLKLLGESFGEAMEDDDNFDNISLTSFLEKLDSGLSAKQDIDGNISITTESSVDFLARFRDLHAD